MSLPARRRRKVWEPLPQKTLMAAIEANPGEGFPWIIAPRGVAPEQRVDQRRMFLAFALRVSSLHRAVWRFWEPACCALPSLEVAS